mmetsp:Transcript_854/g.1813  ORF Transcript_854/g.1813 Transcript_854/m.1813 type:complete len:742 (-) Transcript_854:207-2432(-)
MPGKRKADEMGASDKTEEKPSKAARLKAARERAAQYAKRDKELLDKVKAKNSSTTAASKTTTSSATATKPASKALSNAERKRLAREKAKEFAARDMAKLESKNMASTAAIEPKKQQKAKETKKPRKSSAKLRKPAAPASSPVAAAPNPTIPMAPALVYHAPEQQEDLPSDVPMEVPEETQREVPEDYNQNIAQNHNEMRLQQMIQQQQMLQMEEPQLLVQRTQYLRALARRQQQQKKQHRQEAMRQLMLQHQQQLQLNQPANLSNLGQSVTTPQQEQVSNHPVERMESPPETVAPQVATEKIGVQPLPSASVPVKKEPSNGEEICPPPTEPLTQAQVSEMVLLNARKDTEKNYSSSEQEDYQEEKNDEEGTETPQVINPEAVHSAVEIEKDPDPVDVVVESHSVPQELKHGRGWLQVSAAIIVAIGAMVSIHVFPELFTNKLLSPDNDLIGSTLCFFNIESEVDGICSDGNNAAACPVGGLCKGGKLIGCENTFQDVSDKGDECVWAEEYLPMKIAITDQLVSHTSQICDRSSKPRFKYAMLQAGNAAIPEEETLDLIEALIDDGFIVDDKDGLYLGLPEGFDVRLPVHCTLGNIGQWFLEKVGLLILGLFGSVCSFVWAYKKLSLIIATLIFCGRKYRRHVASKARRQEDIKRTRALTYKTLEDSPGVEHWAIHIRDEIALALYPDSKKLRLELQKRVWPKIVDDVKRDTRIRKFQKVNEDGKVWEKWQWTAATKTPSQS